MHRKAAMQFRPDDDESISGELNNQDLEADMTTVGLCTHFTQADDWAFDYALGLVRQHNWQLNICHWLHSPFRLRRDIVQSDLFKPGEEVAVTPQLLVHLEQQLRQYYDERLGDFTNVAFKLCEGMYQVELERCLRQNLLDLVVMGYQPPETDLEPGALPLEEFALHLPHPLVIVGSQGPRSFLLNAKAVEWLPKLDLPEGAWAHLASEKTPA
jgi:hypothetical protein